jgi:phospholipid transport system substrate-binding protein
MSARRSGIVVLAVAALVLSLKQSPAADVSGTADAMTLVKSTVNQVLDVLKQKDMPIDQKRQKLRAIVADKFDFTAMSRSALGYHWRDLSEDKRNRFTKSFSDFLQDAYLNRIQNYSGQEVAFLREVPDSAGYAEVRTKITQESREPVAVNYMLEQVNGQWKVYDVTVDNISITSNYRNQFNRVMNRDGFDALMKALQNKQQELSESLGKTS